MKHSNEINLISQALINAQKEIGVAHKDSKNPFFKSNYADLNSVMDACKKALNDNDIAVIQSVDSDPENSYVETILSHKSGQFMSCRMKLITSKNDMQGLGSAITYARRYTLQAMAFVAAEDDDGNAASVKRAEKQDTRIYKPDMLLELIAQEGVEPTEKTCEWVDNLSKADLRKHILAYEKKIK